MGISQKRKGKAGEREFAKLLQEHLGVSVVRNLVQSRQGGADLIGLPGWAIEVKRAAMPKIQEWWQQTCSQAEVAGERPVLTYRLDRHSWRIVLALRDVAAGFENAPLSMRIECDIEVFSALVREKLVEQQPYPPTQN